MKYEIDKQKLNDVILVVIENEVNKFENELEKQVKNASQDIRYFRSEFNDFRVKETLCKAFESMDLRYDFVQKVVSNISTEVITFEEVGKYFQILEDIYSGNKKILNKTLEEVIPKKGEYQLVR